ncbi:MAG: short-chain-enoyl-CoA hydratase [Bacteroidales bacterium]|jgi:enoyl-CoA hydratase
MEFIKLEQFDHVAVLTINREKSLNALNSKVLSDLNIALDEIENNDEIYVVVITGAGRSFVAGADISEMKDFNAVSSKAFADFGNKVFLRLENLDKPVIAAINGFALGGGCELSMACDIRLASIKAKFGQPEVGLGVTPGFGGTQRLPRLVGYAKALELMFTGKIINAEEAHSIGLVNDVYQPEELMPKAMEMAHLIAAQAQIAVRISKQCIRKGMQTDINTAASYEALAFAVCFDTEDKDEGMEAFLEKRSERHFKNR